MAQTIKMRRSATPSAVPSTAQLALGEMAINTYDGKVYIKKDVGGVESIVEVTGGGGGASVTISTSAPSTPSAGDLWFDSTNGKLKVYYTDANSSQWVDAFVGTVGPTGATGATGASGTIDGTTITTFTGLLKGNGSNISTATVGTDYLAPPSGTSLLKANSGGALANAAAGTDYVAPGGALGTPSSGTLTNCTGLPLAGVTSSLNGLIKCNGSSTFSAAVAGTDYQEVLVSATNIKTVKSTSLLGSGDIPINEPPTGGTTGQVLTKNSATNYDYAWATPGATLTHVEGLLGADVQMPSSNTWYDGPTVSLAAGTWLVNCHMTQIRNATTAENIYARISDGTTHHASQQAYHPSASGSGCNVAMTTVLTVASTTTIKGQMATSAGSTNSLIKAAMAANGAGNNASIITAIKIG